MATNDGFVITEKQIKDLVSSCGIVCVIFQSTMSLMRGRAFQICDDCLKDLREIIKERRKHWIPDSKGVEPNCKKEADNGND